MVVSTIDTPLDQMDTPASTTHFDPLSDNPGADKEIDDLMIQVVGDDGQPLDPEGMDPDDPLYNDVEQYNTDDAEEIDDLQSLPFDANLADHMEEQDLHRLADDLMEKIEGDLDAREDWARTLKMAVKELGLRMEPKSEPWDGCATLTHSMLLETIIRFQAEAVQETFNSNGPTKPMLTPDAPAEVQEAATRISADINALMTGGIPGFRTEHERMLFTLGLCGTAGKEIRFDPNRKTLCARNVPANDLIMAYDTPHLSVAPRYTLRLRMHPTQVKQLQESGLYRDIPLTDPGEGAATPVSLDDVLEDEIMRAVGFDIGTDEDGRHILYQIDWEGAIDAYDPDTIYPWLITIDAYEDKVLAVYRNWREDDPLHQRRVHMAKYGLVPAFGAYDLGYAHLLLTSNVGATDILRNLIDAGTLSNLPAGYKTKGMRVAGDNTPLKPSEWRDVDVASGVLKDNFMPLPYKEPSATLYNLLGTVVEEGRRVAAVSELKIQEMPANAPVGTTLALLERSLKPLNAIQGRLYDAIGDEIELIRGLLRDYGDELRKGPLKRFLTAQPQDFEQAEAIRIVPTLDPVSGTMTQRIAQFQAAYQLSQGAPDIYDRPALHRQMLKLLGIARPETLVPDKTVQQPQDPVAENMAILNGAPVKAFESQDHDAHLAVHMAAKNDPLLQQMVGQSPQAQAIMGAGDAHIREHVAFAYKRRVEQALGKPLPAAQTTQIDQQLAPQIAQASDQVLHRDQQQAAAQVAAQNAKDPVLQQQLQQEKNAAQKLQNEEQKNNDTLLLGILDLIMRGDAAEQAQGHAQAKTLLDTLLKHKQIEATKEIASARTVGQGN